MPIEELESKIRALGYHGVLSGNVDGHEKTMTRWPFGYDVAAEATKYCEVFQV